MSNESSVLVESIAKRIYTVRGLQVMLDAELVGLYGVQTNVLNQADKRNSERFPPEFMFQLSEAELEILSSQNVTSSWGGRRYPPYAFTEQGVAMLSAVLRSETAVAVSIHIMNAFVSMRRFIQSNALHKKWFAFSKMEMGTVEMLNKSCLLIRGAQGSAE